MTIRAAVFDMDGLLIDTEPIWRQSEIDVFGRLGLHLTEAQCLETMGVRIGEVVGLWYSRHPWDGPSIPEVTHEIERNVIEHVLSEGKPKPGVRDSLVTVQRFGLATAIASSSSLALIAAVVERLNIGEFIDVMCSGNDESEGKPHPAVYLSAAQRLNVRPDECIALEDSPNGVLSARRAGMYCIAVPDPYLASDPRMDEANLRLDSLEEFTPDLLAELTGTTRVR